MTEPGRTPLNVVCPQCGLVWCSVDSGRQFSQPPAQLFRRHPEAVLATVLRGGGKARVRATFQNWSPRRERQVGGIR